MLQHLLCVIAIKHLASMHCCVSDPDSPTEPVVSSIEQTSVKLSWQPGGTQVINRTNIVYRTTSAGRNGTRQVVTFDKRRSRRDVDDTEVYVLNGLEPATQYVIYVEVYSFGKVSRSPKTPFETRELCSFVCF